MRTSVTGRGDRGGDGRDFFPTPAWCVHRLLDEVGSYLPLHAGARWLEPAVGESAIVRAQRSWHGGRARRVLWSSSDIVTPRLYRPPGFRLGSYLEWDIAVPFDVAITNPPFVHDEAFVEKMRHDAHVSMSLLRLDWLGSAERNEHVRRHPPDVFVIPDRPSFTGDGNTDAQTYAWFVYGLGSGGRMRVLKTTSTDERKRAA